MAGNMEDMLLGGDSDDDSSGDEAAEVAAAQRLLTLSVLAIPGLVVHVVSFLDAAASPDVMNVLLCVGPAIAGVVRKEYLTNNDAYLIQCTARCIVDSLRFPNPNPNKTKTEVETWMRYNGTLWKHRCLGQISDKNVHKIQFARKQLSALEIYSRCGYTYCNFRLDKDGKSCITLEKNSRYSGTSFAADAPVVSIGGEQIGNITSASQRTYRTRSHIFGLFQQGRAKSVEIEFLPWTVHFFSAPTFAIQLGLDEVLRFMVDSNIINANSKINGLGMSLLEYAGCQTDVSCLKYLLSLPEIELEQDSILHDFSKVCSYYTWKGLEVLLRDGRFDVNRRDRHGRTPLYCSCLMPDYDFLTPDWKEKVSLL